MRGHGMRSGRPSVVGALLLAFAMLGAGGCACTLFDDIDGDDDDGEGRCFVGERCPDGSCVWDIAGWTAYDCCGFGGECAPCDGNWFAVECPDGTCVAPTEPNVCCAFGGACDPGDDSSSGPPSATSESTDDGASTTDPTTTTGPTTTTDPQTSGESTGGVATDASTSGAATDAGTSGAATDASTGAATESTGAT